MKINKIYELIFKEIIKPKERQRKFEIDKNLVFITPNGYFGFVLCKKETPFNLEMIQGENSKIDLLSVVKPENRLRKTKHFVMFERTGLLNVFCNSDRKVYINTKFLNYFEDYAEFYQAKELTLCVVVENGEIVGAVMPVRYIEEREQ